MRRLRISTIILLCLTSCVAISFVGAYADDWPQWRGLNRDGVWHETGIIESFDGPQIEHKWRADISNGYSGPTVADGRVYVTDLDGTTMVISHADRPKLLARNRLDDSFSATAAIAGNELYLRGSKSLYCIVAE